MTLKTFSSEMDIDEGFSSVYEVMGISKRSALGIGGTVCTFRASTYSWMVL
jgi:hypothetical protein